MKNRQKHYDKPGLSSRQAASKLLSAIIDKKTSMDGLLDLKGGNPAYLNLSDQDRLLVKATLLSTLRNYQIIEKFIDHLLEKPLPTGAVSLRHILRIGAAQILYLEVPDHSAVDLAVEQANIDPRNRRFANLVNAILRRMAREKEKMLPKLGEKTAMLPDWYAKKLSKSYGFNRARKMMQLMSQPAPVDITVKSDADLWADKLGGTKLTDWSVRLDKLDGPLQSLLGFEDGDWWVQDLAASLPARLFGDLNGKRVIDLCAAPGGKTAQLILAGAEVTALDRSKSRLNRLNENLDRLKLTAQTEISRMEKYQTEDLFDMALLDAPCSSTGTIRRHPDVVWTKDEGDISYLADVQKGLLDHAITLIKPGGVIIFSNCSLEPEEGEDMITQYVADNQDKVEIEPIDSSLCLGFQSAITEDGFIRTTPDFSLNEDDQLQGADGFFAARLRKKQ